MNFNKTIHQTINFNAPVSKVWDALTKPELMKRWLWEADVDVVSDWKEGSVMLFHGTFHDMPYTDKGFILKLENEKVFAYKYWSHLSQLPDRPENYLNIEFELHSKANSAELQLTCSNTINEAIYGHWNFYLIMTLGILKKSIESEN